MAFAQLKEDIYIISQGNNQQFILITKATKIEKTEQGYQFICLIEKAFELQYKSENNKWEKVPSDSWVAFSIPTKEFKAYDRDSKKYVDKQPSEVDKHFASFIEENELEGKVIKGMITYTSEVESSTGISPYEVIEDYKGEFPSIPEQEKKNYGGYGAKNQLESEKIKDRLDFLLNQFSLCQEEELKGIKTIEDYYTVTNNSKDANAKTLAGKAMYILDTCRLFWVG